MKGKEEVILDFSKIVKEEKMRKEIEEHSKRARESGYVKRKRRELREKGVRL